MFGQGVKIANSSVRSSISTEGTSCDRHLFRFAAGFMAQSVSEVSPSDANHDAPELQQTYCRCPYTIGTDRRWDLDFERTIIPRKPEGHEGHVKQKTVIHGKVCPECFN
ncbi:Fe-S oxidoreductase [Anopheles sinensis]|uniref:Fe-S oxidoreductase n=1 Tax=Anopheles sinensis TaxID=74873 RepID=A0A084WU77_ANOSI|nr:Fe-S oxidoreductase [Anopheles sinensis]